MSAGDQYPVGAWIEHVAGPAEKNVAQCCSRCYEPLAVLFAPNTIVWQQGRGPGSVWCVRPVDPPLESTPRHVVPCFPATPAHRR